ncbi:MAG: GAF domain-containing protein [Chloroflexi bacterium]|nr:GAF domain-containing protein [Chloroflexota bacterium]
MTDMALGGSAEKIGARRRPWFSLHLVVVVGQIALGFFVYGAHELLPSQLASIAFFTDAYHPVHWVLSLLPPIYAARFLGSRYALGAAAAVGAAYALYGVLFHMDMVGFSAIVTVLGLGLLLSGLSRLEEQERRSLVLALEAVREHTAAVERQAEHLAALGSLATAVSQSLDITTISGRALEVALPALKVQFGLVHLYHAEREVLLLSAYRGWTPEQARQVSMLPAREGMLGQVVARGELAQASEFAADPSPMGRLLQEARVSCFAAVPIMEEGKVLGVFSIAVTPPGSCSDETMALLRTMGHQLGAAIANARRYEEAEREHTQAMALARVLREDKATMERLQKETGEGVLRALGFVQPHLMQHSRRVQRLALGMAQVLALPEGERDLLSLAALFHDAGFLALPHSVVVGEDPLRAVVGQPMALHPERGAEILGPLSALANLLPLVRGHHERWDGTGYPDGLAGEQIPPLARLLAAADGHDWLVQGGPGRPPISPAEARARLEAGSGTHWEPRAVEALLRALDKDPSLDILSGGESPGTPRPA